MNSVRRPAAIALLIATLAAAGTPAIARADVYDPHESGHPLRMLAYALHPIGVVLDYAIMRPFHWIGHQPGMRELFGHED
jgi:uncharacterized RDD family membrane protein YckC